MWLVAGANLLREKSTAGWLAGWWLVLIWYERKHCWLVG